MRKIPFSCLNAPIFYLFQKGPTGCDDISCSPMDGSLYPFNGDCGMFCQCSSGTVYEMPCAPGTNFNPAISVCDWPANAGCGKFISFYFITQSYLSLIYTEELHTRPLVHY